MNLAYFGRPMGVQSWSHTEKYHFWVSFLNYTSRVKRNRKFSICFYFKKGKQNYQKKKSNKCSTLSPDLLWKCSLMQKHKFYRKKMRICVFLTLSIFFVKCAVVRSFKAFFILTNISKHIFLRNKHLYN